MSRRTPIGQNSRVSVSKIGKILVLVLIFSSVIAWMHGDLRKNHNVLPKSRNKPVKEVSDMFEFAATKVTRSTFLLNFTQKGQPITWKSFIELTKSGEAAFVETLRAGFLSTNFKTVFFNCPPLSPSSMEKHFSAAVLNAPYLDGIKADPYTFREKFKGHELACSFTNLGGDALLVSPTPMKDQKNEIYSSLGPFIHFAPLEQQIEFWKQTAIGLEKLVPKRTMWLNTEGSGVYWTHMRLDSRPKYYHYRPFTNENYYAELDDDVKL